MKKNTLIISFLFFTTGFHLFAEDSIPPKPEPVIYTIGYNKVPDQFNIPLIGFINVAKGNHKGLQLGFSNRNGGDFSGLEISFANAVGGSNTGSQIGLFNAVGKKSKGLTVGFLNAVGNTSDGSQIGFFNAVGNKFNGLNVGFFNAVGNTINGIQVGFLNTTGNSIHGFQVGFTNILGNRSDGIQIGVTNVTGNAMHGLQVGFVNILGNKVEGMQIGFLNKIHELSGIQLGFVNLDDTVAKGIPVGFFTLIKKGGYQALEIGTSGMFPLNIAYKTGLKRFYTSIVASYSPVSNQHFALGMGIGTILPLGNKLSFNPEILSQTVLFSSWNQIYSLNLNLAYALSSKLSITAGPSFVWNHLNSGTDFQGPFFSIYNTKPDSENNLLIGLKAALIYQFRK